MPVAVTVKCVDPARFVGRLQEQVYPDRHPVRIIGAWVIQKRTMQGNPSPGLASWRRFNLGLLPGIMVVVIVSHRSLFCAGVVPALFFYSPSWRCSI